MTLPVHLVAELKKHVDKPVKHWHHIDDDWPVDNKLILMKMASGRYYVGTWDSQSGFRTGVVDSLGETVVKWMYIPEDE